MPERAMLRHRAEARSGVDARLLVSAAAPEELLFAGELDALARDGVAVHRTYTRRPPSGWTGFARRVDAEMLRAVGPDPAQRPRTFVCGPTAFVETVAEALVGLGHEPATIRTERFGPTGG